MSARLHALLQALALQHTPIILLEIVHAVGRDHQPRLVVPDHVLALHQIPDRELELLARPSEQGLELG